MTDKRTLGQGNVTLALTNAKGETKNFVLKPSIHAMRTLSRKYGGLHPLVERISKLDFDVIADVIEVGLQRPGNPKERAELEELVYHTGFADSTGRLPELCVNYVTILIHGGRMPPEQSDESAEGNVGASS